MKNFHITDKITSLKSRAKNGFTASKIYSVNEIGIFVESQAKWVKSTAPKPKPGASGADCADSQYRLEKQEQ